MKFPGILVGDSHSITRTVEQSDTAGNYWDSDVGQLLSTPSIVSMMMEASARMVHPKLPDGFISVGKSAEVVHEHPSVVGAVVSMTVSIESFDGYHIGIAMEAHDNNGLIARGAHVRSIVNAHWLQVKISNRINKTL